MSESQADYVRICFIDQLIELCEGNDVQKPRRQCLNLLHRSVGGPFTGKQCQNVKETMLKFTSYISW